MRLECLPRLAALRYGGGYVSSKKKTHRDSNPSLGINQRQTACSSRDATAVQNGKGRSDRERRIPGKMLGAAVAVPLRPASAAETESTAQSLSRACLLVGRDALVAGCLDWALLTTAEVGWAPQIACSYREGCQNGFFQKQFLLTLLFFHSNSLFFFFHAIWHIDSNDN